MSILKSGAASETDSLEKGFRNVLSNESRMVVAEQLQQSLVNLLDLGLQLKQAHWNLRGSHFRPVHLELDEIVENVRESSDAVAERLATIGIPADGTVQGIVENSQLAACRLGFTSVEAVIEMVKECLFLVVNGLRNSIALLSDEDPVSEDLLIGVSASLEKHLWMIQSQLSSLD